MRYTGIIQVGVSDKLKIGAALNKPKIFTKTLKNKHFVQQFQIARCLCCRHGTGFMAKAATLFALYMY